MKNVIYLSHEELEQALRLCYRAEIMAIKAGSFVKLPAVIWGDPGIGKTSIARALAKNLFKGLEEKGVTAGFWTLSLSYKEVVDIGGYAVPNHESKTMIYFPPEDIPYVNRFKGNKMPYGVLVIDDVDRAPLEARNGAMSLLLERSLNCNEISPNVYVCATANGISDAGTTSPLGGAFGNRMVHLYLRPEKGWSEFLGDSGISSVEDILPIKKTKYTEVAMCTPRSIEMAKWIIEAKRDEPRIVVRAALNGCVGEEAGAILTKVGMRNFSLDDIMNDVEIDVEHITFDDIELLRKELEKVPKNTRSIFKQKVSKWAEGVPGEFGNIVVATMSRW